MKELHKHEINKERNRVHAIFECVCEDPKYAKFCRGVKRLIKMGNPNGSFYTDDYLRKQPDRKEVQMRIDDVIHTFYMKKTHCGQCGNVWYYAWTSDFLIVHTEEENIHTKQIA